MLLVLVRELESRHGEILNFVAKTKKDQQLLRAPSVGKQSPTSQGNEGRKARTVVGREEKSQLCDPGCELPLGGREKKKSEDIKRDGKNGSSVAFTWS